MSVPFAPVDTATATLLDLLADEWTGSTDAEYATFTAALADCAARNGGTVRPNVVRPMVAGRVKPCRVGPFYRRACKAGLIVATGDFELSDDTGSGNAGKPSRTYRWLGHSP